MWLLCYLAACWLCGLAAAIDPIEAVGNKFFRNDGTQFFIKGERITAFRLESRGRR